jgi:hypothetical protein
MRAFACTARAAGWDRSPITYFVNLFLLSGVICNGLGLDLREQACLPEVEGTDSYS